MMDKLVDFLTYLVIALVIFVIVGGIFCLFWWAIHTLIYLLEFETKSPKLFSFIVTLIFSSLTGGVSWKRT